MSPVLDTSHDLAHPVEGDGAWSESYYFNAYDPEVDCGFYTRIGIRPNEGSIDVGLSVWVPGGGLAHLRWVRPQDKMIERDLEVGPVRYRLLEEGKRWQLTASGESTGGPLSMDVTFEALTPLIGADGQPGQQSSDSSEARQVVGKGHLEQAGRWSGVVEIAGRRSEFGADARGNRDKSWGPRRWGGPRMWRWFSINIDDDTHFGGIVIGTDSGDMHRGWVWSKGELSSIRTWDVTSELEDEGDTHRVSHVKATDKADRIHVLEADLLRVEPGRAGVRAGATIVNEGLARWHYEGRTGYGISEYLHQLDGDARPVVPIR